MNPQLPRESPQHRIDSIRLRWMPLCVLWATTIALRALLILAPPTELSQDRPAAFEEMLRGTAALELTEGPLLEIFEYQWNGTWGGSLVMPLLAAPGYLLFGSSLPILRAPTLLFACLAILIVFRLLDRYASRRAAWIGGAFMAITPPGYSFFSSAAWGTHTALNVLALAVVYLFLRYREQNGPRYRDAFALGLLAGFGIYFGTSMLITLTFLTATEFVWDRWFWRSKLFLVRVVGVLLGMTPGFLYKLWEGALSKGIRGSSLGDHITGEGRTRGAMTRLGHLISDDFANSLYFSDLGPVTGAAIGTSFTVALFALAIFALWRTRRASEFTSFDPRRISRLFACFLLFYFCIYAVSDFKVKPEQGVFGMRYMMPLLPWLLVLAALGLDALWARGSFGRRTAQVLLVLLLGTSLVGNVAQCQFHLFRQELTRPGHNYATFGRYIANKVSDDPDALEAAVARMLEERDPEVRVEILFAMGQTYKLYTRPDVELPTENGKRLSKQTYERARARLHEFLPKRYKPYFEAVEAGEQYFSNEERERFENLYIRAKRREKLERGSLQPQTTSQVPKPQ